MELDNKATARNASRRALVEAGKPVAAATNENAPRGLYLNLSKSYTSGTKLSKRQKRLQGRNEREVTGKPFVAAFIGTNDPAGGQQEFGNILHKAQPHFRPVWEGMKMGVLKDIQKQMKIQIDKAVIRARKKALKARL